MGNAYTKIYELSVKRATRYIGILVFVVLALLFLLMPENKTEASVYKAFNYQGKLLDDSGWAVANGNYSVYFLIYDDLAAGSCLWSARGTCGSPTAKTIAVSGGIFSTMLGESGDNALPDFTSDAYYLEVRIDYGGSPETLAPRKRIGSVPQALNANALVGDGVINLSSGATTTDAAAITVNSLTTGNGLSISSTSLTSGALINLSVNSTTSVSNTQTGLKISTAGANGTSTQTTYGGHITNTHTGTASTNVGLYLSASGGTNNYGLIVENGNVGIGTASPVEPLNIFGSFRMDRVGVATKPTLALAGVAGNVDNGTHYYRTTWVTAAGEGMRGSDYSNSITVVDKTVNGQVNVTIPVSTDSHVTGRRIYRSAVADGWPYYGKLLAEINDNTTTLYVDNIADASLGAASLPYGELGHYYINNDAVFKEGESILAIGTNAGDNAYGIWNTYIGKQAGQNAVGNGQMMLGYQAGKDATGSYSLLLGAFAGNKITAGYQVMMGYQTGADTTSGGSNTFVGSYAGNKNVTGGSNVYIGQKAGEKGINSDNVAIGTFALQYNKGAKVTAIGTNAGKGVDGSSTADNSVFIGYQAANGITTGDSNILIGYKAADALTTGTTNIVLGYDIDLPAVDSSNMLDIGNLIYATGLTSTGTTISTGKVGIGTTAPDKIFEINSADGNNLRLTYNDSDGSAANYIDYLVSSGGVGTIAPSGAVLNITGDVRPTTDDTYYLGKNDDDTPQAWKGVILKDTTNGKYYRIEIINGVITPTDLTD